MHSQWFTVEDIIPNQQPIVVDDVCGYVLPHAGTEYTGDIIQHTLRFQPINVDNIHRVYIYYYPANSRPDVTISVSNQTGSDYDDDKDHRVILSCIPKNKCHHELYVPFRSILHYFRYWRMNIDNIQFIPVNVRAMSGGGGGANGSKTMRRGKYTMTRKQLRHGGGNDSFFIISADFSHHKPFQYAIDAENKAAHAIITESLSASGSAYLNEIDDVRTFRVFMRKHKNLSFQWIGRTRSPGESAVGYLSFLIRPRFQPTTATIRLFDGIFVTCYDAEMNARECLGMWYGSDGGEQWNQPGEDVFVNEVTQKARTTSRLTGGKNKDIPITRCVITYLFKDAEVAKISTTSTGFIRGWHSIRTNAIYLPDVLLEHAKEDGQWITPRDLEWRVSRNHDGNTNRFDVSETLRELDEKAGVGIPTTKNITLYMVRTCVKKIAV